MTVLAYSISVGMFYSNGHYICKRIVALKIAKQSNSKLCCHRSFVKAD